MSNTKSNQQSTEVESGLPKESLIYNHKLRGDNESFWDAMNQGRAARSEECSAIIATMTKK